MFGFTMISGFLLLVTLGWVLIVCHRLLRPPTDRVEGLSTLVAMVNVVLWAVLLVLFTFAPVHGDPVHVTGTLALGKGWEPERPLGAMIGKATLDISHLGPFTLNLSYRHPFGENAFWRGATAKFNGQLSLPLSHGRTLFAEWERNPVSGKEWGWAGIRVPFRLR